MEPKKSMDIIVDSLGGTQLKKDFTITRPGGRVVLIGASSMRDRSLTNAIGLITNFTSMVTMNSIEMLMQSTSICGFNIKRLGDHRPELVSECLANIKDLFAQGKLKTFVSKVYDWKDIAQAHKDIESRATTGKLILQVT